MKGLEEQLLGRVIAREQNALEKLLNTVLADANANTKALLDLDAQLLDRLSSNTGNLLDDEQLVDVLANTKAKAAEVKEKLAAADETKRSIGEKREHGRLAACGWCGRAAVCAPLRPSARAGGLLRLARPARHTLRCASSAAPSHAGTHNTVVPWRAAATPLRAAGAAGAAAAAVAAWHWARIRT
jgi:hypothetical protein